jgi:hypothetical protein
VEQQRQEGGADRQQSGRDPFRPAPNTPIRPKIAKSAVPDPYAHDRQPVIAVIAADKQNRGAHSTRNTENNSALYWKTK